MKLSEIVSVSQMPGIFKVVGKKNDGLIVTSLVDGKSQFISGRTNMFSTLDNITIYGNEEPIELRTALAEMKKQAAKNPPASPNGTEAEIRKYFESVLPDHDKSKVYLSDIKKLIKWFAILDGKGLIEELIAETEATAEVSAETDATDEKAVKKAAKKTVVGDDTKTEVKPKATKSAAKSKVTAPKAPAAPKKITTPRKAS
jgi:hypothetical protein